MYNMNPNNNKNIEFLVRIRVLNTVETCSIDQSYLNFKEIKIVKLPIVSKT